MKLAVSNIAWSYPQRLDAYAILRDHGITGLEIAPGLLFADEVDPFVPSREAVLARLRELDHFGLQLVSMQSLLFGIEGADLFGEPAARRRLEQGLVRAIELAGKLHIANLVFGSPKQRVIPPGLAKDAVLAAVTEIFRPLGDQAAAKRTHIALEPNAAAYGTNFMTTFQETLEVVRHIGHAAVTFNFDVGALYMNQAFDQVVSFAQEAAAHISHVHVSSAHLAPAPMNEEDARAVFSALKSIGYDRAVSIEMKASPNALETLATSVALLKAAATLEGLP
ncbi:sugar phosphate isomerase/epimerase family protein [Nitrospirillum amazonense]|uniref:Sugar phosphate isomerase/epimerase n=1 Tax=Nitrospirillum amazonense TaxID=28077 RepID=A0A560JDV7_9PROT|nr:sugar phosphate isomerase/epimerase family protein [Nitrospirillum amazonense]MDG3438845.1 sugar phosphate isomerase/epimerase [Nitrospirillum amazonense]TWB69352.1 sugar phosphate isomerase/epimerase [Nitrospirillum amazonense]